MFDNYEMTLIRIEGLGDLSNSTCNLIVNNELFESVAISSLENSQNVSIIPSKSHLKFQIEGEKILASLQFSLGIIKCQGYHWLPLFVGENDLIEEVPEEVGLPRILLIFQSRRFLSPVIEITETSELSENIEFGDIGEENSKNVELRMKIIELEQSLQFERINQMQTVEKMTRDYKSMLDKANFEMEKFKVWSGKYKEKCLSLTQDLENKENELKLVKLEKETAEIELSDYKEKYLQLVKSQEKTFEDLEKNESALIKLQTWLETRKKSLQIDQTWTDSIQIKKSKAHKSKLLRSSEDSPENLDPELTDSDKIDYYLQDCLSHLKLEGFFQKTTEKFYRVGCKKVGVVLKNKNIYCKFGDSLKTLENYIYNHCSSELENFIKKRANSKPGHRRYKTFSGSLEQGSINKSFKIDKPLMSTQIINKSITPCRSRVAPVKAKKID